MVCQKEEALKKQHGWDSSFRQGLGVFTLLYLSFFIVRSISRALCERHVIHSDCLSSDALLYELCPSLDAAAG